MVQVPDLPPSDTTARRRLLDTLTASPPPASSWEVGGMTNFLIAAARLGMRTATVGHIGDDVYGQFLSDILEVSSGMTAHVLCLQLDSYALVGNVVAVEL